MARMRQNLEGSGSLRCQCGWRVTITDGTGECLNCGKSAEDILRDRVCVCALDGCCKSFMPTCHQQRCCCPEHARSYELQEQRKRRAQAAQGRRKARSATPTRENERKAVKASQKRFDAHRVHVSRVVSGLAPAVADPFVGDVTWGVPWGHAWAGLDPLPCGGFPARFKQTSARA